MTRSRKVLIAVLTPLVLLVLAGCGFVDSIQWVSVDSSGVQQLGTSDHAFIAADASSVAFQSDAVFVIADANSVTDIYVRSLGSGTTERASVADDESEANGASTLPSLSGNGARAAFISTATNLVASDTNGRTDVFVRDLSSQETTIVSVATDGTLANRNSNTPTIASGGSVVVFQTAASNLGPDANLTVDVFARDMTAGTTTLVSVAHDGSFGDGNSTNAYPSADGTVIAFVSEATNLVPGDTNAMADVFVRDLTAGTTTLISSASNGGAADGLSANPMVSADGRFVAFASEATNLVDGDTNALRDVFVHDRTTGETTRASISRTGAQVTSGAFNPAISPDGQFVAFNTVSAILADDTNGRNDIYVHNRTNGDTYRVSKSADNYPAPPLLQGDGPSTRPTLANNGRAAAFETMATTLLADGNVAASDVMVASLSWDSLPPATTHDAPSEWANAPVTVTLTPADYREGDETFPVGPFGAVRALTYIVDGTTNTAMYSDSPPTSVPPTPVTFSSEGVHTLEFYASDHAENVEAEQALTISIDLTDPTVSGTVQPTYTGSAVIPLSGSDALSGLDAVYYELSQPSLPGPWTFVEYTSPVTVATPGAYQLRFYSVDEAGNESEIQSAQFTVAATPQPPAPPATPPATGGTTIPWTGGEYVYILVTAMLCAVTGLGLRLNKRAASSR